MGWTFREFFRWEVGVRLRWVPRHLDWITWSLKQLEEHVTAVSFLHSSHSLTSSPSVYNTLRSDVSIRDSAVDTATALGLDGPGFESR